MFSKIIHFFDRPKKDIIGEFCDRHKNYGKFMEWQDDDDDSKSSTSDNICQIRFY